MSDYDGECVMTRLEDDSPDGFSLRIDQADPRILVAAEVADQLADCPTRSAWLDTAGCDTYIGALLKINGINLRVVYRLTGWYPHSRVFTAEWPD